MVAAHNRHDLFTHLNHTSDVDIHVPIPLRHVNIGCSADSASYTIIVDKNINATKFT